MIRRRKKRYQVKIPDLEYFKKNIPCQEACPVHTHSGGYVTAIGEEKFEEAFTLAHKPNPFVYVCGRICAHPCEDACRRSFLDEPISIRALKRAATDRHQPGYRLAIRHSDLKGEKVAVVGAGPAGLSCAYELAKLGYRVTIFEAQPKPGGMLYLGIPEYRLPRNIIEHDINAILALGITLITGVKLGQDLFIKDLREQGFKAIFLAIGAHKGRELKIEGIDLDGVLNGVDFLLNVNLGYRVDLGAKVIVIGGGNVAIDVARSAIRRGDKELQTLMDIARKVIERRKIETLPEEEVLSIAADAARTALRLGAEEVHLVCLESRAEMPAHEWEVEEAEEEGIIIHTSRGPKRILGKDGRVIGLETLDVASVFDDQGRFNPTFIPGTEKVMETDSIILAVGQTSDLSFIRDEDGLKISRRGLIEINPETLETTSPGIFAGGDVAFGPRLVIEAVADGQKAARSIDSYLTGKARRRTTWSMKVVPARSKYEDYDTIPRQKVPVTPVNRRMGIDEVELGYDDATAVLEGKRCLKCAINTIFDSEKCILCGGCVDVCPYNCLKLVKLSELIEDKEIEELVKVRYGIELDKIEDKEKLSALGTAIIKDETLCIRCGLCQERCPTKAITLELFEFEEEVVNG
jgi:NADPH-dependent glutamate synthase beta subunit-like oxidoreductase